MRSQGRMRCLWGTLRTLVGSWVCNAALQNTWDVLSRIPKINAHQSQCMWTVIAAISLGNSSLKCASWETQNHARKMKWKNYEIFSPLLNPKYDASMIKNQNPGDKKGTNKTISSNTMKILMMAAYNFFVFNRNEINPLKAKSSSDSNDKITRTLPGHIEV